MEIPFAEEPGTELLEMLSQLESMQQPKKRGWEKAGKEAEFELPFAEEPGTSWDEELLEMLSEMESMQRVWEKAGKEAEFELPFAEEVEPWARRILKGKSKQQPKERFTHYRSSRSVLQTVLVYQLEQA